MLTQLSPKTRPVHPKAFTQAKELQALLMDAANDEDCTGPALAQIARAWSELEERKRVLKMRPKPKDVDVTEHLAVRQRRPRALNRPIPMPSTPAE